MNLRKTILLAVAAVMLFSMDAMSQLININTSGGFEDPLPSYWKKGNEPSGATLTWATDQSVSLGRSLKISKSATSDSSAWVSENMVDYWSERHYKNVDMKIGAWVKTQGVNTSPTTNDQKWYIAYTFYDSAGVLIGQTKLPIDQSVATSTGFVADTNAVGATVLPKDSWKTIISFVAGKNATGTVWADNFILIGRGGAWAGQDWNTGVGVPTGWTYWLPPNGGNDGLLANGYENTRVTTEAAHSGLSSLKFDLPFNRQTGDGFVGTKRMLLSSLGASVKAGDVLRISVWIKASNLVPDSAAKYPVTWAVGFTPGFWKGNGNNDGFNNVPGYPQDLQFVFPPVTSFDWTQYYIDVTVPSDPTTKALDVRLHPYARFTGTVYFDDLTVEKLAIPQLSGIGGFEDPLPSYWKKGNEPSGATLTWATDQSVSLGRSLKISKSATSDSSAWVSENMVDYWSERHYKNVDMKIGAWVKTQGVNTSPTTNDQKWYIAYTFYDSAGVLIGQTKLPIDQSVATSTGFVADTNAVGATVLPKDSWKTIISFVAGKNATGTVWADNFILIGRGGAWAGQDWNTGVGVPTGWTYWLPPNGGNDGLLANGYENTRVTTEAAHSGLSSLKFDLPFNRQTGDGFVGTKRMLLSSLGASVKAGDVLRISVWIKASNLVPDSAAKYPVTWAVGFTPGFWKGNGNNDGFNNVPGYPQDLQFVFPPVTSFDWTQYYIDVTVPSDPTTKALDVRLHPYARFTGTVYFDDLTVEKLAIPQLSGIGGFEDPLPSYWKKGNEPSGATLTWATDQSVSLGRSLKISKSATSDSSAWVSENMVDYWSERHYKNVDMKIGAWVKTQGVNTSPTTNDQKWYIAYTFYDSAGVLIGQTKLPIDQSVATSTGFVADTNAVGATVLPKDSWKTIISFVAGKNATGTVWADNFILIGRGGAWAGQDWNTGVGVPTGWTYWLPPNGGNDGLLANGYENTRVTTEAAHSGLSSLKFDLPFNRQTGDGFVGTKRFLLSSGTVSGKQSATQTDRFISTPLDAKAGDIIRISVWIKASNLVPDSAAKYPVTWAVGLTPGFWKGNGNNDGFNNVPGYPQDLQFVFPPVTSFNWTQYYIDVTVPSDPATKALDVRLHPYARFTGTVYFDDLTVQVIGTVSSAANGKDGLPRTYELSDNYPNPFNPSTNIKFALPHESRFSLVIYNVLGQRVRTLAEGVKPAGRYTVQWDGRNDVGEVVQTGVFFYRLETEETALVKRMVLLK